ncbi:MAG TPA: ABC transporter permease [Thermogutta sp.]|nr:ABC transporter permease [Thermogutta sp.]HPU05716.1 ABC transporter permease [Thermogutta sp.]HQF13606.1 ABC transporter permease [Thermogutta sp.]
MNAVNRQNVRLSARRFRLRCVLALARKESYQIVRDPSSLVIAFLLPVVLLFLFGWGISLDLGSIPIGLVVESPSRDAERLVASLRGSRYFIVREANHRQEMEPLLVGGRIKGLVIIPQDFAANLSRGSATVQILVNGSEANTAEIVRSYLENVLQTEHRHRAEETGNRLIGDTIHLESRVWYNPNLDSRAALLPGSIAVIMTLIGTILTSLVVAREWERGTMEALLASSITRGEFLLGKFIPYFALGLTAMMLVALVSVIIFHIPFRGSWGLLIVVSAIYLTVALGLGLFISTATRNQFVATQAALVVGYLPSFILSGLVFEINSMPTPIRLLTHILPPRYFVSALRTLFLAGNVWEIVLQDTAILAVFATILWMLTIRKTRLTLE